MKHKVVESHKWYSFMFHLNSDVFSCFLPPLFIQIIIYMCTAMSGVGHDNTWLQ